MIRLRGFSALGAVFAASLLAACGGSGHGSNLGDWQHHSRLAETAARFDKTLTVARMGSMGAAASTFASMPCHPSSTPNCSPGI